MKEESTTRISRSARRLNAPVGPPAALVLIHGDELGKRFPVETELYVGRAEENEIVLERDNVSRRHARFFWQGGRCWVEDLGSTNGTWVNDVEVTGAAPVAHGDLVQVGSVVFKLISGDNPEAAFHEEIYRLTILDGLTQVHNRRYLNDFLEREVSRCSRSGGALSLILFDIDDFKALNDSFGHQLGDRVLREIARLVQARVRREQLLARYGGDEFVVVLPDVELESARLFADRLRRLVAESLFDADGEKVRVSISTGVASLTEPMTSDAFLKRADDALYTVKRSAGTEGLRSRRRPARSRETRE